MKKVVYFGGLMLAVVLASIQSIIWNGPDSPQWLLTIFGYLDPKLIEFGAKELSFPPPVYFEVGRFFVLVYALLTFIWAEVTRAQHTWLRIIGWAGLAVAILGDVSNYWFGTLLADWRHLAFIYVEVPGLVLTIISFVCLYFLHFHSGRKWLGLAVIPLCLLFTALFQYIPHGPVLGLVLVSYPLINFNNETK